MCECLCSTMRADFVFTPEDSKSTVAIDIYAGCAYCSQVLGVDIRLFDEKGRDEWLDGNRGEIVSGDKYGHLPTLKSLPMLDVEVMERTLRDRLEEIGDYDNVADWFSSNGLEWLQDCIMRTRHEVTQ